jgi:4-hydroxy-3-polyprenylbenzoate decarboxylase
VATDEDIDPTGIDQVIWAMASRCNPVDDSDVLRNTWSTWLDAAQNPPDKRPYGSKALIDACKEHRSLPVYSKQTMLRKSVCDTVAARRSELGLPRQAPKAESFESDTRLPITKRAASNPARRNDEPPPTGGRPARGAGTTISFQRKLIHRQAMNAMSADTIQWPDSPIRKNQGT